MNIFRRIGNRMAKVTGVPWAKSTFNPWIGCTPVSVAGPYGAGGCDNCYAELQDARKIFGGSTHWGAGVPRLRTSEANWDEVRRWNDEAPNTEFAGRKGFWPVFSASLGDIFDNEVPEQWRSDFWALVKECKNLTFQIVTKRIGNAAKMLPPDWGDGYPNVWLMITVVNQHEADRDIPKLLRVPAALHGLSVEPMLERMSLLAHLRQGIGWVVNGGESGNRARPMHPTWPRLLRDECRDAGVPYLFKQHGEWLVENEAGELAATVNKMHCGQKFYRFLDGTPMMAVGAKVAGRILDGVLHDAFPE